MKGEIFMKNHFLFLDTENRNIEGKNFCVIYILEFYKKQVFKIYKLYDPNTEKKLATFKKFDNINEYVDFVIKRDGKISLDIKL